MPYLAMSALHVFAMVVFLGNIVTGLCWHAHTARRSGELDHAFD